MGDQDAADGIRGVNTLPLYDGEFGWKIMRHVPQAMTLCLREPTVVEIEEGEEALYPAAEAWIVKPRDKPDIERHVRPADLNVDLTRFVPHPYREQDVSCDIVVCPRKREYGSEKNWPHWVRLTSMLRIQGANVFAGGAPDSSYDVPCHLAWEHHRFLDATIEAMLSARLVIATDAGLAHLAVLCGRPLLLITYDGLVAPGPVRSKRGRKVRAQYWEAGTGPSTDGCRFEAANHRGVEITKLSAWDDPYKVACAAMGVVRAAA